MIDVARAIWDTAYDATKTLIKYQPEKVVDFLMEMMINKKRIPMWHWDDGGTHLATMEYNDDFVKAFMEFLPLARTVCVLVVISTPVVEWVLKKLHTATGVILAPVIKLRSNEDAVFRPRQCKPYRKVKNPMATKYFPQYQWEDTFSAIMPDSFYKWYKPERDHYARLAIAKMQRSLQKKKASGKNIVIDEGILAQIEASVAKTQDKIGEFQEVIAQKAVNG